LYECMEKVTVRKNKWATNHDAIDAFRTAKCDPPHPGKKDM